MQMYNNVMFYIHYLYCYTEIYSKLLGTRRKVTFHRNFIILVFIKCDFFVQHSLVYNSLTMERDLAHRIETEYFYIPTSNQKTFSKAPSCPHVARIHCYVESNVKWIKIFTVHINVQLHLKYTKFPHT
jgi:hypothetical protein